MAGKLAKRSRKRAHAVLRFKRDLRAVPVEGNQRVRPRALRHVHAAKRQRRNHAALEDALSLAVVEQGDAAQVFGAPQDPYTQRLLDAVPQPGGE